MAELLLAIKDFGGFEDGDIIHAWNDDQVLMHHANKICYPNKEAVDENGLRPLNTKFQKYLENTHQYKFERDGLEVTRTNLFTQESEVVDTDAVEWMARRLATNLKPTNSTKPIFGTPGNEVWYGGKFDVTKASDVWDMLEKEGYDRTNYKDRPLFDKELTNFLVVPIQDVTTARVGTLTSPQIDLTDPDNPVTVKKRRYKIDYRNDLSSLSSGTKDKIGSEPTRKPRNTTYDDTQVITDKDG